MACLNDVYRKFGEVGEACQLIETELGTLLLREEGQLKDLLENPNQELAKKIYSKINKYTTGQLFKKMKSHDKRLTDIETAVSKALHDRNLLFHHFFRKHNFRRNTPEGCQIMLDDLENMHKTILEAYKKLMLFSGIDLDQLEDMNMPKNHVDI